MFDRKNLLLAFILAMIACLMFPSFSSVFIPSVNATEVQGSNSEKEIVHAVTTYGVKPGYVVNPNSPGAMRVTRIIRSGEYALANWLEGEGGGQAALIKKNGKWTVIGAGGGAMDQRNLVEYGFPPDVAKQIIDQSNKPPEKTLK